MFEGYFGPILPFWILMMLEYFLANYIAFSTSETHTLRWIGFPMLTKNLNNGIPIFDIFACFFVAVMLKMSRGNVFQNVQNFSNRILGPWGLRKMVVVVVDGWVGGGLGGSNIPSWCWWNFLTSANQIAQIGSCDRSRIHVPDLGGTGVWPGKK